MASAEAITYGALKALVGGQVYPDQAPANTVAPYIVYQSVGGVDETDFDGFSDLQNSRMQVAIWAASRADAGTTMQQILQALTAAPVLGKPIGAPVSVYEDDTNLYGSRLDVSIWYRV